MAFIKGTDRFCISKVDIKSDKRAIITLSNLRGVNYEYDLVFQGDSNRILDAYRYLCALPEWVDFVFDGSDVDVSMPGSGGVLPFKEPSNLYREKVAAKDRMKEARILAEQSGFAAYNCIFDSDNTSIQRLFVAAQAALHAKSTGMPFGIEWTLADNSSVWLTEDQLICLPIIRAKHVDDIHTKYCALKAQIDLATSTEEVVSVVW